MFVAVKTGFGDGAVTDRSDPMRQLKITQLLLFFQAAVMAALMLRGVMTIELLFALSLVTGTIQPFYATARQTIVPSTVPRSEFSAAVAIDSALFQASRFVGPAIAGLIVPIAGVGGTFIESRSQRLALWISALVGLTWTVATYFVGPVLMFEESSIYPAVRRSVEITRKTWGDQAASCV